MSEKKSKWEQVGETQEAYKQGRNLNQGPGSQYHTCEFILYRRGDRWKAVASDEWGSDQGHLESHGGNHSQGRGDNPTEAIEAIRRDVLAWAEDNPKWRAELASTMRDLEYAAEDADFETDE